VVAPDPDCKLEFAQWVSASTDPSIFEPFRTLLEGLRDLLAAS
jgi:hypothetical protein